MSVTLPAGYKPSAKEEYMNDLQLEYFKRKLIAWKEELLEESEGTLEQLKENTEDAAASDMADRASDEIDKTLELRTRDRARKLISKIDSAIKRIDEKDYGYCEETGEPIGLKRLEARPVATLTIEAQEHHEKLEKTLGKTAAKQVDIDFGDE